ncbi:hypothetical protein V6N11_054099 [Hibiscus sabdariffa]|uniref:Uncharacterized protein n=1 Tax=Hibiscus sabdariffa TaxID=183260 RepID=A0ABR2S3G7_9ROSI
MCHHHHPNTNSFRHFDASKFRVLKRLPSEHGTERVQSNVQELDDWPLQISRTSARTLSCHSGYKASNIKVQIAGTAPFSEAYVLTVVNNKCVYFILA